MYNSTNVFKLAGYTFDENTSCICNYTGKNI